MLFDIDFSFGSLYFFAIEKGKHILDDDYTV